MPSPTGIDGGLISTTHEPGELTPEKTAKDQFSQPKDNWDSADDFLMRLTKRLEKEDEITDRLFHQKWTKLAKFYEGEHLGRFDARGQWRSYQPQMGDPYYIHPELRFHSDAITAAWTQSRPDIRVLPANDDDKTVACARKAAQILDHYEDVILTEDFLQRESKLGQFTGQMYRYTWWNPGAGPEVERYDFDEQQVPLSSGAFSCPSCGYSGPIEELEQFGECPQCGAPAELMELQEPQSLSVPVPRPIGKQHIGDVCTEVVPAFQIKVDRAQGSFAQATYLRRRRMVRPEIVKELFPFWDLPSKNQAFTSADEFSLRAERLLQQSTGAPGRAWRPDTLSNPYAGVVINQWWLAPCLYATREPEAVELRFAGGQSIPVGTRLIDVFPNGLYLLIANNLILDMREEYLHDHWQHSPFISIPTRVEGDGIEDLLEPARQLDDLMSLVYIDMKANAAPPTIVNTTYGLKTTDVSGKPHWVVPARVPTGENIQNAIWQQPGRQIPVSVFRFIDMLKAEQQLLAKSFSSATGAPDAVTNGMAGDTATAAQLATSAAQSQRAPELAMRAAGSVIWARQVLRLFQKNAIDEHYVPLQGRYGLLEGSYFKGADIDADFIFTVRNRSWIPRDEFSRRSDLLGAIQAGLFSDALPRAVREEIAEIFNVSITITSDIADTRIARMRLDQMKQLFPQLAQMAPPEAVPVLLIQAVPLEPVSDNHTVMAEWYKDWLKVDEGLTAPPEFRQTVIMRIMEHQEANALQQQQAMALQMRAMAPMIALQASQEVGASSGQEDKSPSESISFKDLPPKGQVQMAEQAGIKISASDMEKLARAQQAVAKAKAAAKPKASSSSK